MASYVLDTKGTQYVFGGCLPHPVSRDDQAQRVNDDGLPVWDVRGMSKTEGDMNFTPIKVQVPCKFDPCKDMPELTRIVFDGLTLRTFNADDGMGIYFVAKGVKAAG